MRKLFVVLAVSFILFTTGTADKPLATGPQSFGRAATIPILPSQAVNVPTVAKPAAIRDFGKVPVYFIPNAGQMDGPVDFYIQGKDKTVYFTPEGVTFALNYDSKLDSKETKLWTVKMDFVGARKEAKPKGLDKTEAIISYFKGKPEDWHAGLPAYSKIIYRGLWTGIDLVYKGDIDTLKYEFIVHPGADPKAIRIALRGAKKARVDDAGRMEIATAAGNFEDETPLAYQDLGGQRTAIPMAFKLVEAENGPETSELKSYEYGFEVGAYDKSRDLVLDPATFIYCGYIGGNDLDSGYGIAVDGSGNAYVTGWTYSTEAKFPVTVGPDLTYNGGRDAFVAKVNAAGTALVYCGYIGGSGLEYGYGIALDGSGNAYVTGWTYSTEATFPVTVGPDLTFNGGDYDAFVAKVKADGTALDYCGYIGGSATEYSYGIAVDGSGNAYVTGWTYSTEATFPVTVGPDLTFNGGDDDAFVAKVKADGTALVYCGYIGGSSYDVGYSIAVDGSGNAYVTGYATSTQATFPVTVGPDLTQNGGSDVFVAKVKTDGTALVYCGYIGGSGAEVGYAIAVDGSGNTYVTGFTTSTAGNWFPVTVGPDLTYNGGSNDVFVAKVKADGTALVYCGYIGGSADDYGCGIAVEGSGNAYVSGYAASTEATFPVTGGPDLTYNGGNYDAFVARVKADGSGLVYCGYVGGSGIEYSYGNGIAVDGSGNAYVTGQTASTEATFPVMVGPDLTYNGGIANAFVAKIQKGIQNSFTLTIAAGAGGTTNPVPGTYTYDEGASVNVQASPATAYEFDSWTGAASGSANPLSVIMTTDKSIQANFSKVMKPPLSLTAERLVNRNVSMIEHVVRLRWQANTANTGTITYRVYQIENGQATAIADLGAGKYEYIVRRLQKTKSYRFGVTAVNSLGWESDMVEVTVQ